VGYRFEEGTKMMITQRDKFVYSYGFLDCFMMMSGDNAKMREKHSWVTEQMWQAFLPNENQQVVQTLINEMNQNKIWKVITETMQGKMFSDTLNKTLKDKMSSY